MCICHPPVSGKKKPSATILASAFGIGRERFFSTSIRDENVRTLSALGPERVSAAWSASGWIIVFSILVESFLTGSASSKAYILWSLSGSFLDGKRFSGRAPVPMSAASSFPWPANSRAPIPRVVRMEIR